MPRIPAAALLALLLPVATVLAQPLEAQVTVDGFTTDHALTFAIGAGSTVSSAATGAGTLGGERDMELTVVAGAVVSGEVTGGAFNFSVAAATSGEALLMWDGPDGLPDAADLDPTGLGGVDLTSAGVADALRLRIVSADQPATMIATVHTDGANFSTFTQAVPVTAVTTDFHLPFASFVVAGGAGADFANVGAVTLFLSGFELDVRVSLVDTVSLATASKTDALLIDTDSDGLAGPGDTLRYTVVVNNPDDATDAAVTGLQFTSSTDPNTSLVVGSVTTSQGIVTTGNTAGDTSVAVDVGALTDDSAVTITYDVVLVSPLPPGLTEIACQGTFLHDGGSGTTDDPDQPGALEPTRTPVVLPVLTASNVDTLLLDTGSDGFVSPGDTVRYTATLSNGGAAAAQGVVYTAPAVADTALVVGSVTTSQGTVTTGNSAGNTSVQIDVGTMPPAGSVTVTYDVLVDTPLPAGVSALTHQGSVSASNHAAVSTDDPDAGGASDPTVTTVVAAPDLTLGKDDGGTSGTAGSVVAYTLQVLNNGDQGAAAVELAETVPANTTFEAASSSAGWVCVPSSAAGSSCTLAVGALAGGGAATARTFAVRVDDPLPAGVTLINNTATVSDPAEVDTGDNSASDTTPVGPAPSPDVGATKEASLVLDVGTDGLAGPGDVIEYLVTVTNIGTGDASSVVFDDTPDPATSLIVGSVTTTQGVVTTGNAGGNTTVSVDLGTLAASGGSAIVTFEVSVDDPLPSGTTVISNQGTVSGSGFPDVPTDDPNDPAPGDATEIPAGVGAPVPIPTLGGSSLVLFVTLLLLLGVGRLGRAPGT